MYRFFYSTIFSLCKINLICYLSLNSFIEKKNNSNKRIDFDLKKRKVITINPILIHLKGNSKVEVNSNIRLVGSVTQLLLLIVFLTQ